MRSSILSSLLFLFLFVGQNAFSQSSEIQIREENSQFAIFNGEEQVTPYLFNTLTIINDSLYIFDANPSYRGSLQKMIDGKMNQSAINKNLKKETDFNDSDDYSIFSGLINQNGKILGGEQFRLIEKIAGENTYPPFFQAQNEDLFNKKNNGEYALVSAEGIVLTKYSFFIFFFKDGVLSGQKVINYDTGESVGVKFDALGKVIE